MTDFALKPQADGSFDLVLEDGDLVLDHGLQTAVVISLFSDRRAEVDDELPDNDGDRRGWWGDELLPAIGELEEDRIGSRRWLLQREKQTQETRLRLQFYDEESLAWMTESGLAASVQVSGAWVGAGCIQQSIRIKRPNGEIFEFSNLWEAHLNAV